MGTDHYKPDIDVVTTAVSPKKDTLLDVSFAAFVSDGARTLNVVYFFMFTKRLYWHWSPFCYTKVLCIPVNFNFDPMPSIYFNEGTE